MIQAFWTFVPILYYLSLCGVEEVEAKVCIVRIPSVPLTSQNYYYKTLFQNIGGKGMDSRAKRNSLPRITNNKWGPGL